MRSVSHTDGMTCVEVQLDLGHVGGTEFVLCEVNNANETQC